MAFSADLRLLLALVGVGGLALFSYVELAYTIFRARDVTRRSRWVGLVVPGAAIYYAVRTRRLKRLVLLSLLLLTYVALRVSAQ